MTLNKDMKIPGKPSVYLDMIICKTHILRKIISLCFKIRSVYVYIPSFCSYVIINQGLCLRAKVMLFPCVEYDKNLYIF